ncbi:MAG: hypothetical protein ABIR76_13135 [Polaromonas sp.]
METITQNEWVVRCAERLRQRWRTVETLQLEEVAMVMWADVHLRCMEPCDAAAQWLKPVCIGHN